MGKTGTLRFNTKTQTKKNFNLHKENGIMCVLAMSSAKK